MTLFAFNLDKFSIWLKALINVHINPAKNKLDNIKMKRVFDIAFSSILLIAFSPLMLAIALAIKLTSNGPILFWSDRVGKENVIFRMPKFRSLSLSAPNVATHLLSNSSQYLTPVGSLLRKTSMDELPQLWSILIGDMSFVGPRPALFNQNDLILERTRYDVDTLLPGLTGWAQVNGRDELSVQLKVQYDFEYLKKKSFWFDIKIIGLTVLKVVTSAGVSH